MMVGAVPYGPPAAGKSTVAAALHQLSPNMVEFRTLKAGPGRRDGYRMTTVASIERSRQAGDIVWSHQRYEATHLRD